MSSIENDQEVLEYVDYVRRSNKVIIVPADNILAPLAGRENSKATLSLIIRMIDEINRNAECISEMIYPELAKRFPDSNTNELTSMCFQLIRLFNHYKLFENGKFNYYLVNVLPHLNEEQIEVSQDIVLVRKLT